MCRQCMCTVMMALSTPKYPSTNLQSPIIMLNTHRMAGAHLGTSHCKGMKYRVSIKTILLCDCGGYIVTAWAMTCLTGSRHAVVTQSTHINRYNGLFAKAHPQCSTFQLTVLPDCSHIGGLLRNLSLCVKNCIYMFNTETTVNIAFFFNCIFCSFPAPVLPV